MKDRGRINGTHRIFDSVFELSSILERAFVVKMLDDLLNRAVSAPGCGSTQFNLVKSSVSIGTPVCPEKYI
jgi:hypothetical protein